MTQYREAIDTYPFATSDDAEGFTVADHLDDESRARLLAILDTDCD